MNSVLKLDKITIDQYNNNTDGRRQLLYSEWRIGYSLALLRSIHEPILIRKKYIYVFFFLAIDLYTE